MTHLHIRNGSDQNTGPSWGQFWYWTIYKKFKLIKIQIMVGRLEHDLKQGSKFWPIANSSSIKVANWLLIDDWHCQFSNMLKVQKDLLNNQNKIGPNRDFNMRL